MVIKEYGGSGLPKVLVLCPRPAAGSRVLCPRGAT